MERKSFPFELEEKGLDPEARTFKGYAAVTGILDDGGDVIDKGAFKHTLDHQGRRVKVFYIHDFSEPIGKPIVYEDGTIGLKEVPKGQLPKALREKWPEATGGLFVHCQISETTKGNDALTLMRDGILDELSIGYKSIQEEMKEDGPEDQMVRHLRELSLLDISPVPLAMNPAAVVTDVKEFKVEETEDYIHVPAPGEEGKHKGHRIRSKWLSKEKGIMVRYCGECRVIVSYLFAKEKGWTVAKARAWVKEHAKGIDPEEVKDWEDVEDEMEEKKIPGSFWSEFESDLRKDPTQDVNSIHRRFHNWAGRGIVIEHLTAADMAHAHSIIAKELTRRCKEDNPDADCAHDSPLSASDFSKSLGGIVEFKCRAWNKFMDRIRSYFGKEGETETETETEKAVLDALRQRAEIQREMIEAHLKN